MEILACTTANGARTFGGATGEKIGTIAPGKFADLVILNSDPREEIARTSDLDRVIKDGVVYSVKELASSLH
jgi:imidazolonepropionase-like amidohydrolase